MKKHWNDRAPRRQHQLFGASF